MKMHLKCSLILLFISGLEFFAVQADESITVNDVDEGVDEESQLAEIDEVQIMDPWNTTENFSPIMPGDLVPCLEREFNLMRTEEQPHVIGFSYPVQKSPISLSSSIRDSLAEIWKTAKGSRLPSNCDEALLINKKNGVYKMELKDSYLGPFHAYCQETSQYNWMFIQRRIDGRIQFDRDWTNYKNGFGDLTGEHWLGLDLIHAITSSRPHDLWIQLQDQKNNTKYAYYTSFVVGDEDSKYALKVLGPYSGEAGDSLNMNVGIEFSTKDVDNDYNDKGNCAAIVPSGWWFNNCGGSNLNGPYYGDDADPEKKQGIQWNSWLGEKHSLKYVHMAIGTVKRF